MGTFVFILFFSFLNQLFIFKQIGTVISDFYCLFYELTRLLKTDAVTVLDWQLQAGPSFWGVFWWVFWWVFSGSSGESPSGAFEKSLQLLSP